MTRAAHALILLAAGLALAGGCDEGRAPFSIELVDPAGQSPVRGATSGRLRVLVAQEGQPTRETGVELVGGSFQLDVAIANYALPTRLRVELERDGVTSLGAVPTFAPFFLPFVRVPLVPSGTCATLATQRLSSGRAGAAMVLAEARLVVVGGLTSAGERAASVERFTPQLLTSELGSLTPLAIDASLGRASARGLRGTSRLVVVSSGGVFLLDLDASSLAPSALEGLSPGAGERSTLVSLGGEGLALVGGERDGGGVASVAFVALDGTVSRSTLPSARREAAASAWGDGSGVLVAGGADASAPTFLFVPTAVGDRERVVAFDAPGLAGRALRGGALVRSPDGAAALYVGMRDGSDAPLAETWVVTGCPSRCVASEGPAWPRPRAGSAFVETDAGGWLVGGHDERGPLDDLERVEWSGATPRFAAMTLAAQRDEPAAAMLAGGLVLVAGGRGEGGPRDDLELCAPSALEPL